MSQEQPAALLYTTRQYPCGCRAEGTGDVQNYCPQHDSKPAEMGCEAWDSRCNQYAAQLKNLRATVAFLTAKIAKTEWDELVAERDHLKAMLANISAVIVQK